MATQLGEVLEIYNFKTLCNLLYMVLMVNQNFKVLHLMLYQSVLWALVIYKSQIIISIQYSMVRHSKK